MFHKETCKRTAKDKHVRVSEGYGTTTNMRGGHANAAEFEIQQQQAEALANSATAKTADRQAVSELSVVNAKLTHELRTATAPIATLQQRLASCECAPTPRTEKNGTETTPAISTLRFYATRSIWILLVTL